MSRRLLPFAGTAAILMVAAALESAAAGWLGAWLAGLAALVVIGLLIDVDLPRGGSVPAGHAGLITLAVVLPAHHHAAVAGLALVAAAPAMFRRPGAAVTMGGTTAGAFGALAAAELVRLLPLDGLSADSASVIGVAVAGSAFVAADFAVRSWLPGRPSQPAHSLPVAVTLLCAAALLALAWDRGPGLALVATIPLLVTGYSFRRFARARETYDQTIEALGLLPEVAGLTTLGHGERTAFYAEALAEVLGFDAGRAARVATAARLHHIGHISLHEPEERPGPADPAELGRVGAEILRETGILADVAELVEAVQRGGGMGGLDAAVVRVCSSLDDLTAGDDAGPADPFLAVLHRHREGTERSAAVALLAIHDARPDLVAEAQAGAEHLHAIATGDHAHAH